MKRLLSNWCGRLYLVIQITCLAISTFFCVQLVNHSKANELSDQYDIWHFYGVPKPDGTLLPLKEGEEFKQDIIRMRQQHSDERQHFIFHFALLNLGVPALWAIGLFVGKGFPKKKTAP